MPVEDWFDRYVEMQIREMNVMTANTKAVTDALAANMDKMEERQDKRMDKLEAQMTSLEKKMDDMYTKLDEFITATKEKIDARDTEHAITLAELKTKIGIVGVSAGALLSAFLAWLFGLIKV